ncbi:MAG: VC_2705 family sodium/solute symporter [Firmicutes bacterium]|nr:VC_2705 family sodium/solute symporter [Bacillota bacterium]
MELQGVVPGFKLAPAIILALVLVTFILVGLISRVKETEGYFAASRSIGPFTNGMAIASNWMSAASFMGMAGMIYIQGYFGLGYVVGWTGGYVLLLLLLASQIRRFGKYTAADFVGDRYESQYARALAAVVSIIISFVYCIGQYMGIGLMFAWIFGWGYTTSVIIGTLVVLSYVLISGMLGVTRNQVVQYIILISAFIFPLFFIAQNLGYFWAIPQIGYGAAAYKAMQIDPNFALPWAVKGIYQWVALTFTLMVGTCGLPHVLMRFYVTPDEKSARWSVVWGLFFIGLLYWSAPAYAAFGKLLNPEGGKAVADIIILSASELAGLPVWFIGLLAAGAVSAAFSTVSGLLMAGSAAFAHDIYFRIIKPEATQHQRMLVARVGTFVLGLLVILAALNPPALVAEIVAIAFAIAGGTMFPAILLGIWWSRSNKYGAIAGMSVGLLICLLSTVLNDNPFWATYIPPVGAALIAAPANFLVNIAVSLATPPPSQEVNKLLKQVHLST